MIMLLPKYYGPRIGRLRRLAQVQHEHQMMVKEMSLQGSDARPLVLNRYAKRRRLPGSRRAKQESKR